MNTLRCLDTLLHSCVTKAPPPGDFFGLEWLCSPRAPPTHCCKAKGVWARAQILKTSVKELWDRPAHPLSEPPQSPDRDLEGIYKSGSAHTAHIWHHSCVLGCWIRASEGCRGTSFLLIFAQREKMGRAFSALHGSLLSNLFISTHRITCSGAPQRALPGNWCVVCFWTL